MHQIPIPKLLQKGLTHRTKSTLFLILSLFLIHCSNSYINQIDRSGFYEYRPGYPELNVVTAGLIDEYSDSTYLNVSAEIEYSSLIFKKKEDLQVANIVLEIQFLDLLNPDNIMEVKQYPIDISFQDPQKIRSEKSLLFERNFYAPPSKYQINVSVTDLNSDKQTTRTSEAYIPDPADETSHITNIQVLGIDKDTRDFEPITSYDLSSHLDSVRFTFQVTNNNPNSPLTIRSRLIRFESDTLPARPMSWPNYSPSSLQYIGIKYSKYKEIASSTRTIRQPGNVTIEFNFPSLQRGNYRFEVFTEGEEKELYRAREFSIKSKNYPFIRTPHELAAPLIYLMGEKEHKKLMEIQNPVELKRQIDRFWLSHIKNERTAQYVIELFYERVEEANKQFSNYKEGWKTDLGMMYILFGPPKYVTTSLNEMVWSYSHNLYDPEANFLFRKPKIKNKFYPFDNYILQRSQQYFNVNYQQVQLWLNGHILQDNL